MHNTHDMRYRSSRHRGTAMMETVLILPVVFVILGLVFFFGNAFANEQQHRILARYDVATLAARATPLAPAVQVDVTSQTASVNELFFESQADIQEIDHDSWQSPAVGPLSAAASLRSVPTGDLAWAILNNAPRGHRVKLIVDYDNSLDLPEAVAGPLRRRSTHAGPSWGYADALREDATRGWEYHHDGHRIRVERRIRDTFYADFDRQLDNIPEPGTRMVSLIRGMLYAHQPGYQGPFVDATSNRP